MSKIMKCVRSVTDTENPLRRDKDGNLWTRTKSITFGPREQELPASLSVKHLDVTYAQGHSPRPENAQDQVAKPVMAVRKGEQEEILACPLFAHIFAKLARGGSAKKLPACVLGASVNK